MQKAGHTDVEIVPGSGGVFDITMDGELRFSKTETGRFPTDDEVRALAGQAL